MVVPFDDVMPRPSGIPETRNRGDGEVSSPGEAACSFGVPRRFRCHGNACVLLGGLPRLVAGGTCISAWYLSGMALSC